MNEDTTTDAGAGGVVHVCPACGTEYAEPTECANGHAPTATVEHDAATFAAARDGDEEAAAKIAAEQKAAVGTTAGVLAGEATPAPETAIGDDEAPQPAEPVPAELVGAEPEPAAAGGPAATSSPITDALMAARDALNAAGAAIEQAVAHASGK